MGKIVRFKTKEELSASGWYETSGDLEHKDSRVTMLPGLMSEELLGKETIVTFNGKHCRSEIGWWVDPLMWWDEVDEVKQLLKEYSNV
jgi:hypothetical protein